MNGFCRSCCGVLLCFSFGVYADDSFRYGFFPTTTYIDVNDPNGPANKLTYLSLFSGVLISDLGRDSRIFAQGYYDKEQEIDGDTVNIHQNVTRSGASVSYQFNSRMTREWKPWFGMGIGYNDESIINRYTRTSSGFLNRRYDDIKNSSFTGVVSMATEWRIGRDWDAGLQIQIEESFNDGVSVMRAGFYFVY